MSMSRIGTVVRTAVEMVVERQISFLSGSIAFFAFVSIFPALLLVLAAGSLFGGEQFAMTIVDYVESYLSEGGSEIVTEALTNTSGAAGASIVGIAGLLWSTLKVFRAIDIAFDRIYDAEVQTSLPIQLRNGIVTILAIVAGFLILTAVQYLFWQLSFQSVIVPILIRWLLLLTGLLIVLVPLYYIMPPMEMTLRTALPGALIAVVGIVLLEELFGLYASQASQYQAYGVVGAILLFLLWLYFGSFILLSGATVNAAIQKTGGSELAGSGPESESGRSHPDRSIE
jgi:membrane protein